MSVALSQTTRRATLVALTAAGRQHIEEWHAFQRQLADEVIAPLSVDDRLHLKRLLQLVRSRGLGEVEPINRTR